jgi:hypothetical protein
MISFWEEHGMIRRMIALALISMNAGCYASSSTGRDTGGDTDADLAEEAAIECMPPAGIEAWFALEPSTVPRATMECTVLAVVSEAVGERIIELDCGYDGPFTLTIRASQEVPLMLWEGNQVLLTYVSESPWWINRWFQMTGMGDFILAGIDADRLYPPGIDPDLMYAPLTLGTARSDCPPEAEYCYTSRRVGVRAVHPEGVETTVPGGTRGSIVIGDEIASSIYTLFVQTAVTREDFLCTDIPSEWYTVLITFFAGD